MVSAKYRRPSAEGDESLYMGCFLKFTNLFIKIDKITSIRVGGLFKDQVIICCGRNKYKIKCLTIHSTQSLFEEITSTLSRYSFEPTPNQSSGPIMTAVKN